MIGFSRQCIFIMACALALIMVFSFVPTGKSDTGSDLLYVNVDISIHEVNLQNHTIIADIYFQIDGLKPLIVSGIPQEPSNLTIMLDNRYHNELNLETYHDYGNGTYGAEGGLKNTQWYLTTKGEGYPFDINFFIFGLYSNDLFYSINGTDYSSDPELNYSYDWVNKNVGFSGINKIDYESLWVTSIQPKGQQFTVVISRNENLSLYLTLIPLFLLLILMIVLPNVCKNSRIKIEFYTAILVFSPMFIFAIQTFIPPRSALSIPEFLAISLIILSAAMLLISFFKKSVWVYMGEVSVLSGMIIFEFFAIFSFPNFSILIASSPQIWFVYALLEVLLLLGLFSRVYPFRQSFSEYLTERKLKKLRDYSAWDGDY